MKAILVGISTNYDRYDLDYSLDELKNLAEALNIEVCDKVTQKNAINNNFLAHIHFFS